jgi:hypothetical protein
MHRLMEEWVGEALLRGAMRPEDLPAGVAERCRRLALRARRARTYLEAAAARRRQLWRIVVGGHTRLAEFCANFDVSLLDVVVVVALTALAVLLLWRAGCPSTSVRRPMTFFARVRGCWWRWWRLVAHCAILFLLARLW